MLLVCRGAACCAAANVLAAVSAFFLASAAVSAPLANVSATGAAAVRAVDSSPPILLDTFCAASSDAVKRAFSASHAANCGSSCGPRAGNSAARSIERAYVRQPREFGEHRAAGHTSSPEKTRP